MILSYPNWMKDQRRVMSILFFYWLVVKVIGREVRADEGSMDAG